MTLSEAPVSAPPFTTGLGRPLMKVGQRLTIGRDKRNQIQLKGDLLVAGEHAEIIRSGAKVEIFDRSGATGLGVYIAGRRVRRARLTPGTHFSIGRHDFWFDHDWVYEHDDMGAPSLYVDDIDVWGRRTRGLRSHQERLLDDVSFMLREGNLLGVIGPSGSGKSTLLRAITGIVPATNGTTYFAGRDLYLAYSELRTRIGMVPQEDVLHTQLKVRRALRYAASLRMAWDVPRKRRWARVDEVMKDLHIAHRANKRIDQLSGGERKRTSVAVELLTKPSLLALDEPTSGLDPHLDREIMVELARAAREQGRTVVVVTHTPLHLDLCDHVLVLAKGGRIAYFGPPNEELLTFFEATSYAEVFRQVATNGNYWHQKFLGTATYARHIGDPLAEWKLVHPETAEDVEDIDVPEESATDDPDEIVTSESVPVDRPEPETAVVGGSTKRKRRTRAVGVQDSSMLERLRQPFGAVNTFLTLCLRTLAVIFADRVYAALLVAAPPLLAVLSRAIPGDKGLTHDLPGWNLEAQRLLIVLIVGAAFMGLANSVREIVKEGAIYRRERAAGLSPTVYLLSKFAVLSLIACLQSAAFVWLTVLGRPRPTEGLLMPFLVELTVGVAAVAIASSTLGLAIGALVRTADQSTVPLVVAVMAQLVLSGALFQIAAGGALDAVSWVDPARWGFAAVAATTDLNVDLVPNGVCDPGELICDRLWRHDSATWWSAIGALALQTAVLFGLARLFLRRYEPGRRAQLH